MNGTQTSFLCRSWLGIGIADGKIDRIFLPAEEQDLKSFETLFLAQTSKGFTDDHLWFSVAMRPARSHFTRCQRLSCCFCVLLCTMLANAMFYNQDKAVAGSQISIGKFRFSWRQLVIGVQSAMIVLPINLLIVQLFRKAAPLIKISLAPPEEETSDISINYQGGKIHRKSVLLRPLHVVQSTKNPIRSTISDHTMEFVTLLNKPRANKDRRASTTTSLPTLESSQKDDDAKQQRSVAYRKISKGTSANKPHRKSVNFQRQESPSLNIEDIIVDLDSRCHVHGMYCNNYYTLICNCTTLLYLKSCDSLSSPSVTLALTCSCSLAEILCLLCSICNHLGKQTR